jgi:hypothetical protein
MFRASAFQHLSQVAQHTPRRFTPPSPRGTATLFTLKTGLISASLVDRPILIPRHEPLGRPFEDSATKETKPVIQQVQDQVAQTAKVVHEDITKAAHIISEEVLSTSQTLPLKPAWLNYYPKFLQPRAGTTFYEMYMKTDDRETSKASFFQRLVYGVPESVLDAEVEAKKVDCSDMRSKEVDKK